MTFNGLKIDLDIVYQIVKIGIIRLSKNNLQVIIHKGGQNRC